MKEKITNLFVETVLRTQFTLSRVVEATLMLMALWWSIILFLPTSTFTTSYAYLPMAMVASEGAWAMYFLFIAIVQGVGLCNGKKKTIQAGLLLSMVTWMFVGTMMMIGSFASTGSGIYILIAVLSACVYFYKGVTE